MALGQVLTHGPVVGGVTASDANVVCPNHRAASVVLWYGTDPDLQSYMVSAPGQTRSANDFTKIILLSGLAPETTSSTVCRS